MPKIFLNGQFYFNLSSKTWSHVFLEHSVVNSAVPHSQIQLNTSLQAITVRATCHKTISVCSIYLSPSSKFNINDFDNLITQLPPPILLLGDYNAHSSLWGCSKTNVRGKLVDDILLKHNLSLLNDGSYTYLHPAAGSLSATDFNIATTIALPGFLLAGYLRPAWQ